MDTKTCRNIETLQKYKALTEDIENHTEILIDKTIILHTATLLEDVNNYLLTLCLDVFYDLVSNEKTHSALLTTFGILEALESFSIRVRPTKPIMAQRAAEMTEILRNSAPPAFRTRSRTKNRNSRRISSVYLLQFHDLTDDNRLKIHHCLVQIKGIISFVFDKENGRCTVRIGYKLPIEILVSKIKSICGLKALIVTKDIDKKNETFIDMDNRNSSNTLEYFPEEDTPPKGQSITERIRFTKAAVSWIKTASNFWNTKLYW